MAHDGGSATTHVGRPSCCLFFMDTRQGKKLLAALEGGPNIPTKRDSPTSHRARGGRPGAEEGAAVHPHPSGREVRAAPRPRLQDGGEVLQLRQGAGRKEPGEKSRGRFPN